MFQYHAPYCMHVLHVECLEV